MHRGRRDSSCELLWAEYGHEDTGADVSSPAFHRRGGSGALDRIRCSLYGFGYSAEKAAPSGCTGGRSSDISQYRRLLCDRGDLSVSKQEDAENLPVQPAEGSGAFTGRSGNMGTEYMEINFRNGQTGGKIQYGRADEFADGIKAGD